MSWGHNDWNGNGSYDHFDSFMDYQVSNNSGENMRTGNDNTNYKSNVPNAHCGSKIMMVLAGLAILGWIGIIGSCVAG